MFNHFVDHLLPCSVMVIRFRNRIEVAWLASSSTIQVCRIRASSNRNRRSLAFCRLHVAGAAKCHTKPLQCRVQCLLGPVQRLIPSLFGLFTDIK